MLGLPGAFDKTIRIIIQSEIGHKDYIHSVKIGLKSVTDIADQNTLALKLTCVYRNTSIVLLAPPAFDVYFVFWRLPK